MNALDTLTMGRTIELPSLPVVGLKILKTIRDEASTFGKLAETISSDPALATRTLGLANSALYGLPRKVDDLEQAVRVIGGDALKNIALSFVIMNGLERYETAAFRFEGLWKRAITAGAAAELLCRKTGGRPGAAFVSALLMDIGGVVIFVMRPDEYLRIAEKSEISGREQADLEMEAFGFDHQRVGSEILERWGIPPSIYGPIGYHHSVKDAPAEHAAIAGILHASNMLSSFYHGIQSVEKFSRLSSAIRATSGLSDIDVSAYIDEAAEKALDMLGVFRVDPGEMRPYSEMLASANSELIKLNASYEQVVIELRHSKERAEGLAERLLEANERLRSLAYTDSLTGLYNHRSFHEAMGAEIKKIDKDGGRFSLIIIDIDGFKTINDSYGHKIGDEVLKDAAARIGSLLGEHDMAARFGGDEFAVLLSDCEEHRALEVAESIRAEIEALAANACGRSVTFTVSVGVGSYGGHGRAVSRDEVFNEVDHALYRAKGSGKNRVCVAGKAAEADGGEPFARRSGDRPGKG